MHTKMNQPPPPKPPDTLSDRAKKLLVANVLNLARKLQDGKTLSAYEVELLRQEAGTPAKEEPKWAKNQVELAKEMGVTRKSIQRWRAEPGFPSPASNGRYDVTAVKAWRSRRDGVTPLDDESPTATALKAENLLLQNEKLSFQIGILKGEYIPRGSVKRIWTGFVNGAKTRSFSSVSRLATLVRLAKDTTEACEIVRTELAEVWHEMEKSAWYSPPTPK